MKSTLCRESVNGTVGTVGKIERYQHCAAVLAQLGTAAQQPEAAPLAAELWRRRKSRRHGFGVQAGSRDIALNMVQKWLAHAQLIAVAIHASAVGEGAAQRREDVVKRSSPGPGQERGKGRQR